MDNKFTTARITAPTHALRGRIRLSGDKSVSIRRVLFALLETQPVVITQLGTGEDCVTALRCVEALGKRVARADGAVTITGEATRSGLTLNCANSGTTARLLMGLLAGREGEWALVGDASLSRRPMERVAAPLREMGARIELSAGGVLPAKITGSKLRGKEHDLKISSAQVKSALLLAGLHANGLTRVREPLPSRDHTERLLGLRQSDDRFLTVMGEMLSNNTLELSGEVPGDVSSAAFWAVAALLVNESELTMERVLLNPLRAGWLEVLRRAGVQINAQVLEQICGEAVGTLEVRHGALKPLKVSAQEIPAIIDEIPALAALAATIHGESRFEGLGELRVKESDRLKAILENLRLLGVRAEVQGETLSVHGGAQIKGARLKSFGDHRIAMAFALAGLAAQGVTEIQGAECAAVSYPEFFGELSKLTLNSVSLS